MDSKRSEEELEKLAEDYLETDRAAKTSGTWEQYKSGMRIFESLVNLQRFVFVMDIPPVPEIGDNKFAAELATDLYSSVLQSVNQSSFFHEDEIALGATPGRATVRYDDDRYDFELNVTGDTISVARTGSKFEDFHNWYVAFTPRLPTLMAGVLNVLKTRTFREYKGYRARFFYQFLLYDLEFTQSSADARNSDIMGKMIRGVPDNEGMMSEEDAAVRSASRIDVNITRWAELKQGRRLEQYKVEAPANKEGAGLWLTFSYGGETYTAPNSGLREPFEHRAFLNEYDFAYTSFLRDKAIGAFLTSLMRGHSFRSSAGSLP